MPPELMPAAGPRTVLPGVNLTGYFEAVLGVGEAARQVVDALSTQGVDVAPVGLVAGHSPRGPGIGVRERRDAPHAINLMCVNPDQVPSLARDLGHAFFQGRYTIGLWWWEVNRLPEEWHEAFEHVDEVWVGTRHVADALSPISPVPGDPGDAAGGRAARASRCRASSWVSRRVSSTCWCSTSTACSSARTRSGLIEAFAQAFGPGEGASLVLKCMNHEHYPEQHARLMEAAARHPDVHVIDRHVPRAEKDAMIAACDCYVSLHRSEGFGITMAEAMALGRPVVATGYSGNLDFMTPENSWLVDHRLVKVGEGAPPYPADADWAEPDLGHAARLMREVFDDPAAARVARRAWTRRAAGHPFARGRREDDGSAPGAGALLRGRARAARAAADRRHDQGRRRSCARGRCSPRRPRGWPAPRAQARVALLRLLKPFAVHQQRVDNELLRAIHTLDTTVRSLASTQADFERALADLRAAPYEPSTEIELIEHPVAGVVEGFRGRDAGRGAAAADARSAGEDAARAQERVRLEELLAGREPVLELAFRHAGPGRAARARRRRAAGRRVAARPGGGRDAARGWCGAALEALSPGGALLVEADNPHSLRVARRLAIEPGSALAPSTRSRCSTSAARRASARPLPSTRAAWETWRPTATARSATRCSPLAPSAPPSGPCRRTR